MRTGTTLLALSLLAGTVFAEITITINGKTIRTSGNSVTVNNDTVIVDGKVLSGKMVEESGESATENRQLGRFSEIRLGIRADVTVTAGKKHRCKITADKNILPLVLTECTGDRLLISAKESYSSTQKVMISIETPLLTLAEINGPGDITLTDVTKDQLDLVIRGSGNITAKGKVVKLRATISGSGKVDATALESEAATISVTGSGDADVHVTGVLRAEVKGSGNITYTGPPSKVHSSVIGSGNIAKK